VRHHGVATWWVFDEGLVGVKVYRRVSVSQLVCVLVGSVVGHQVLNPAEVGLDDLRTLREEIIAGNGCRVVISIDSCGLLAECFVLCCRFFILFVLFCYLFIFFYLLA
jgi:hypothetical protein